MADHPVRYPVQEIVGDGDLRSLSDNELNLLMLIGARSPIYDLWIEEP